MTTAQTQTLPASFTFLETCIALNLTLVPRDIRPYGITELSEHALFSDTLRMRKRRPVVYTRHVGKVQSR